jgi:hypothetical protein
MACPRSQAGDSNWGITKSCPFHIQGRHVAQTFGYRRLLPGKMKGEQQQQSLLTRPEPEPSSTVQVQISPSYYYLTMDDATHRTSLSDHWCQQGVRHQNQRHGVPGCQTAASS